MNIRQNQRLNMYRRWIAYLLKYSSYTNSLPNYSVNFTAANAELVKLQATSELIQFDKGGVTMYKSEIRKKLVYNLAETVNKVVAYCKINSNYILLKEVKYTLSDIKGMKDNELRDAAQGVYDKIQVNLLALATYSISGTTQATFLANINAFTATIPNPTIGINETSSSNEQLNASFKKIDDYMGMIDALIEMLRFSQPDFYSGYKKSKKTDKKGMRHYSLTCRVIDATSKEGIEGATLIFSLDQSSLQFDSSFEPITKITAKKGGFNLPNLAVGIYNIEASKDGYFKTKAIAIVEDGKLCKVKIEMNPIDFDKNPNT